MTQDVRKYEFIDALRGYAILLVIMVHASSFIEPTSPMLREFMLMGKTGVQLFYIASALTLSMSWEFRKTHETAPIRNFFIRRFFRIAPMFYVAILFYLLLYGFSPRLSAPSGIAWWYVPLAVLFMNGYHPEAINSIFPGSWSIAVEMNFYLVLPFVLQRFKTTRALFVFLLLSLILYVIAKYVILFSLNPYFTTGQLYLFHYYNFFGQLPVFAIGLLTYKAFKNQHQLNLILIAGWLAMFAIMILPLAFPTIIPSKVFLNHVVFGVYFALLSLTLARFPLRLLVNKPVIWFGKLSFSMYLTHFAILELFQELGTKEIFNEGDMGSLLHYFTVVIMTAFLSYLLYFLIEKNGVLFGKNIIDRLESR